MNINGIDPYALELLIGAYDLHVHSSPSHFDRALDDFELVREANSLGMAGVLIKNHYEPTASRAALVNKYSGCNTVAYGGIALNWPVGGLNPYAAESALRLGAAIVWMPTRDSENCLRYGDMAGDFFNRTGITAFRGDRTLKDAVFDIMDTVKKYDACLATGHLSPAESIALCREGLKRRVRMILTHPEWYRTMIPLDVQLELAKAGALIEKDWYDAEDGSVSADTLIHNLAALPTGTVYLATDAGQSNKPHPAQEMLAALEAMLGRGVSREALRSAICRVPAQIVRRP